VIHRATPNRSARTRRYARTIRAMRCRLLGTPCFRGGCVSVQLRRCGVGDASTTDKASGRVISDRLRHPSRLRTSSRATLRRATPPRPQRKWNEHGRTAITSAYPFGQCPYADGPVTTAVVRPIVMRCRACALGGFGSSRHQLRRRIGVCSVRPITTATSPARTSGASGAPVDGRLLSTTNTPTIGPAIGSPPSLTQ
jgi:hypothetical protein